jgi:hypothetical protein
MLFKGRNMQLGGFIGSAEKEKFLAAMEQEYHSEARSISLDYYIAIKCAEMEKRKELERTKYTIEVIDYIDNYYETIYNDVTNVSNKVLMNPTSVYQRTIRHLRYRFKTFDKDLVDARLEKYGIIADYKIMRKIKINLIINAIASVIVCILLILLQAGLLWSIITAGALFSVCALVIFISNDSILIKEPGNVKV